MSSRPLTLPIAILAGGLATRLRPITETIPKALVPVAGRPFLAHQLELLKRNGAQKVVLCVGYLGEQIVAEIGDGSAFGLDVQYSFDGPHLRGTAGAIRQALPLLGEAFFVLYGDSYLEIDYAAVERAYQPAQNSESFRAVMTIMENSSGTEISNVWYESDKIIAYNKRERSPHMRFIDYGLGIFPAFALLQNDAMDLSDIQRDLAADGRMDAVVISIPYHEIGSHSGLKALDSHLTALTSVRVDPTL